MRVRPKVRVKLVSSFARPKSYLSPRPRTPLLSRESTSQVRLSGKSGLVGATAAQTLIQLPASTGWVATSVAPAGVGGGVLPVAAATEPSLKK
jgi:hypothetical protein